MKLKNLKYFVGGRGAAPVFLSLGLECSGEIGASNLGSASAESSNCPEMSLLICEARKNPLIFFISRSWAFHCYTSAGGWKMTVLRTQLGEGDDFAVSLFPCFSIFMHFCSHLIPCRLIVKWLQNRTSRWFWWSELVLSPLLAAANEHKAELNQGPKEILLEEFIFNVRQMKNNISVLSYHWKPL